MKKIFALFLALSFTTALFAKDIQELVVTTTPQMSCQNCENKIKGNLRFEKGVKKVETNLKDQRVVVEYDADKTSPEKIEEAFNKIGYKVEVVGEDNKKCENQGSCNNPNGACCGKKADSANCCNK